MTWTAPTTRSTNDLINAAIWNQDVVDNPQFLKNLAESAAILHDQKTDGTDGGTFTSGGWRTRDLTTIVSDERSLVSLASNQFTPAAGDYLLLASAPAYRVDGHVARLYNATGTSIVQQGTIEASVSAGAYAQTRSFVLARFTANGTDAYEIQHQCDTTRASDGLGEATGTLSAGVEVYTQVLLIKLDD